MVLLLVCMFDNSFVNILEQRIVLLLIQLLFSEKEYFSHMVLQILVESENTLLGCCRYCFNYFIIYKM